MISSALGSEFLRIQVCTNGLHHCWIIWIPLTTFAHSFLLIFSGANSRLPKHLLKPLFKQLPNSFLLLPRNHLHLCCIPALHCTHSDFMTSRQSQNGYSWQSISLSLPSSHEDFSWIIFTAKDTTTLSLVLGNEQQVLLQMALEWFAP